MRHIRLKSLLLTAVIYSCSFAAYGQEDTPSQRVSEFLKTDWEVRTATNEWQFTGQFIALPEQLRKDLLVNFPKHRFLLAEMRGCGHLPCRNSPLIVITDDRTREVVGFIRDLTWGYASKSFKYMFNNYQAKDKEEIKTKLEGLVKLIALTHEAGSVGESEIKKNSVSVELLWGDGVWRIIEAKFDGKLRIRRMSMIDGRNGRRLI
jgi:hypothetical protein